jgi:hypothetical protein
MLTKEEAQEFLKMLKFEIEHSDNTTMTEDVEVVVNHFTEKPKGIEEVGVSFTVVMIRDKLNEVIKILNKLNGDNNNE